MSLTSKALKGRSSLQSVRGATEALFETYFSHDSNERLESGHGFPPGESTVSRDELAALLKAGSLHCDSSIRAGGDWGVEEGLKASGSFFL